MNIVFPSAQSFIDRFILGYFASFTNKLKIELPIGIENISFSQISVIDKTAYFDMSEYGKFSVDLCQNARAHLQFLRSVHSSQTSLKTPPLESLRRYQDLWLPLVHENQSLDLIPPVDIAWLWHCHRLAPKQYTKHLKEKFGPDCPILDAKAPFSLQLPGEAQPGGAAANTSMLWSSNYPNEDFFLSKKKSSKFFKNKKNNDLLASTERQAKFLWQVSGDRYSDINFLKQGVEEYYKFLNLRNYAPDQIIVPTLQIDLMWHTHILSSLTAYQKDCISIMKTEFNHDDSIEDKSLEEYFKTTKYLWNKHYEEDYYVEGGMSRGEPPKEFYKPEWAMSNSNTNCISMLSAPTVIWCWKETADRVQGHSKSKIVGDPSDGWIQYDTASNKKLEQTFQKQGRTGSCIPTEGYSVNFSTMKQNKVSTGYERDIQRFEIIWCWQETPVNVSDHTVLVGDPVDCMMKYDKDAIFKLETAFQEQEGTGTCLPMQGYVVDFDTMKQIKMSTGFERKVGRVPVSANAHELEETEIEMALSPSQTVISIPAGGADSDETKKLSVAATATTQNGESSSKRMVNAKCILLSCCCCILLCIAVVVIVVIMFAGTEEAEAKGQSIPSDSTLHPVPTTSVTSAPVSTAQTSTPVIAPSSVPGNNYPEGKQWRCGYPPENGGDEDSRGNPTCLRIKPKMPNSNTILREPEGPLCMYGGEPLNAPPMWCYEDPDASVYKSYYLWWSPCTRCGTAWRLDEDRDDDKSMFKHPTADPWADAPWDGDFSWIRWLGSEWSSAIEMEIAPCDPEECWVPQTDYVPPVQTSGGSPNSEYSNNGSEYSSSDETGGFGVVLIAAVFVFAIVGCIVFARKNGRGGSGGSGGRRSSYWGGGGGGCGGGCGGGGGGCGGC